MRRTLTRIALLVLFGLTPGISSGTEGARFASHLGLTSRAPSAEEIEAFKLPLNVRHQGQVVERIESDGPADKAGLRVGDVLLSLDMNELYSFDDVRDFVATSAPGRKISVTYKRKGVADSKTVTVEFAKRKLSDVEAGRQAVEWEFSGLAQVDVALKKAKAENKPVLVGISGAET